MVNDRVEVRIDGPARTDAASAPEASTDAAGLPPGVRAMVLRPRIGLRYRRAAGRVVEGQRGLPDPLRLAHGTRRSPLRRDRALADGWHARLVRRGEGPPRREGRAHSRRRCHLERYEARRCGLERPARRRARVREAARHVDRDRPSCEPRERARHRPQLRLDLPLAFHSDGTRRECSRVPDGHLPRSGRPHGHVRQAAPSPRRLDRFARGVHDARCGRAQRHVPRRLRQVAPLSRLSGVRAGRRHPDPRPRRIDRAERTGQCVSRGRRRRPHPRAERTHRSQRNGGRAPRRFRQRPSHDEQCRPADSRA